MATQVHLPDYSLTDAEREVYQLVEYDGLEPADAAYRTGRSASCARTLLQRARDKKRAQRAGGPA